MLREKILGRLFSAGKTLFETLIQDFLSMSISFLLALYLVFPRSPFNMESAFSISRRVHTLRLDGYLSLRLLTPGNLAVIHRLMKHADPMAMAQTHFSMENYLQNRHITAGETGPKIEEELLKMNGACPCSLTCA